MSSDRVVEEIKQRLDLVEYIGRTVELRRAGRTYKARCPFHVENTPSFVIFPHTGTWHCFGACGEGGDIFSYVQKRDGLGFREALVELARDAGVELETESPARQAERERRERLLALTDAAASLFREWLFERPDAAACRDYIASRGIDDGTVARFMLGYAPAGWSHLLEALVARGYATDDMAELGLIKSRDSGGYYDAFRDRLIFPIRDIGGRVIGFGARALADDQQPKYLNSPQSELFDKGRTLYGLDLARESIRSRDRAVIVEGYMDVIAAHQAGYDHVVAALGTALTGDQIALLYRYSPNLVLALDADEAGRRAAERALEAVAELEQRRRRASWSRAGRGRAIAGDSAGDLRLVTLPEGQDPDDLIRGAPDEWEALVEGALPAMDYLIDQRRHEVDLDDPVQRARLAEELLPRVAELGSALVRDHYIQRLARLLRSDERTLSSEMARLARRPRSRATTPPPAPPPPEPFEGSGPALDEAPPAPPPDEGAPPPDLDAMIDEELAPVAQRSAEAYLLYFLMEYPDTIPLAVESDVVGAMWERAEDRELFEALVAAPPESPAHLEEFLGELPAPVARRARALITLYSDEPLVARDERETEARDRLDHFLVRDLERRARRLEVVVEDLQREPEVDLPQLHGLQRRILEAQSRRLEIQRRIAARRSRQGGPVTEGPISRD